MVAARIASPENVPEPSSTCLTKSAPVASSRSARARAPFPFSKSITGCCGPCGVVDDAPASSKRSGKSTGLGGAGVPGAASPAARPGLSLRRRCAFRACLRFIVNRYVTFLRRAAAAPLKAGIIRLRHGASRRLAPAALVACPRRPPHSISPLRRSRSQAPPLGSRRPVAARPLAASL